MIQNIKNLNLISALVIIFPISMVSGPLLPEIILLLLLLLLFGYLKNSLSILFKTPQFKFFILFNLILILSSLISKDYFSLKSSVFYFRYSIIVLAVYYILEKDKKFINNFVKINSIFFLIIFADEIKQAFTGTNFFNMPLIQGRASSFFGDELVLGSFISRILPVYVALCIFLRKSQVYILFSITLAGASIFLTDSRVPLFNFLTFLFLYLIIAKSKKYYLFNLLVLFLSFTFLLFYTSAGKRIFNATYNQIFKESEKIVIFSLRHQAHFETAIKIFKNNPFLGIGPNRFRKVCDKNIYTPRYTYNDRFLYANVDSKPKFYFKIKSNKNSKFNEIPINIDEIINSKPFGDLEKNYFIFPADTSPLGVINEFSFVENDFKVPVIKKDNPAHLSELSRLALKTNYNWISVISNKKNIQPEDLHLKLDLISIDNPKIIQSHIFDNDHRVFIKKKYLKDDIVVTYQIKYYYLNGCNTHPHNLHLQVLSEIGLIGYLFLGIFIIYLVILLFKNYKNRNTIKFYREQYCLIMGILINFFPLIPSGNFFNNWMNFLFYLPIGFLIYFKRKND